jgi:Uncharacterized protein conserved in bacteria (DUF2184)
MKQATPVRSHIFGADVRPVEMAAEDCAVYSELSRIGINIDPSFLRQQVQHMMDGATGVSEVFGADDTQGLITTASISSPVQFLQSWLPGFVRVMTAARKIDELIGITTAGKWDDEEVIQGVLEPLGEAVLYGDYTNVPLSSWNLNFERRTVLRFEKGIKVGILEDARSARVRVNNAAEKRAAASLSLDITRNRMGFYGFNGGTNRTYGFLNDPSLPAYVTAAATGTGSSTLWANKTFLNITADLRGMFSRLRTASQDQIDPSTTVTTLALPTNAVDYLTVTSDFGISVRDWLKQTYPKCRVVSAPELNLANGGANVAYLYADKVDDGGSDGGATWVQIIPSRFQALGTEKQAKAYLEDFSNATAGVMVKRPFAVQRLTGI